MSTRKDEQTEGETLQREETETKEPSMYKVVLLNDDYTSMDFVVMILQQVFHKNSVESQRIMLAVHQQGSGVAGVYTRDIAETKIAVVHQLAQQHEFPLRCILEQE